MLVYSKAAGKCGGARLKLYAVAVDRRSKETWIQPASCIREQHPRVGDSSPVACSARISVMRRWGWGWSNLVGIRRRQSHSLLSKTHRRACIASETLCGRRRRFHPALSCRVARGGHTQILPRPLYSRRPAVLSGRAHRFPWEAAQRRCAVLQWLSGISLAQHRIEVNL